LGNEYYLRSESACSKCYADRYPNAAAYVSAARRAAEAMRAVDPSIYIIVLLQGPLSFRRADSRDDSKANAWADAVAFASPRFFDGVSTHTYIFTSGGELTSEAGWLFSASQAQPVRLKDWLQAKFGPGVQNWQTETGVPFNSSPAVQLTVLEALVDADVILQNAKFADVHRNLSRHALNLGSEGTWQYCGGDDLFKTVSYHVYSKLNEVLGRATRAIPTELSDVPTFSGTHQYSNVQVPVITAGAWKAADGSIDLALVNKDGRPLTLKLAGEGVVPNGGATTYTVSGPIGAKNTCSAPSEVTPLTNTVSITGSNPTITVPAYSFTVLTIKPS
ncbi:MAG: alpha-L-arabinofuranosidase C-terminal domain-containing protein, partial [Candidatus Methylomirabilales bacterium]